MFLRLVYESFRRQKRRKLLAGVAIALGAGVATSMIAVATDVGDKMSNELRAFGANLVVTPQEDTLDLQIAGVDLRPPGDGAYLQESDIPKIHGIFWHNNIVGFAPVLPVTVEVNAKDVTLVGTYFSKPLRFGSQEFQTGVRKIYPWWKVNGAWPEDGSGDVLLGERLAATLRHKPGDEIEVAGEVHRVAGVLTTGGAEDDQIVAPLAVAQRVLGRPGTVRRCRHLNPAGILSNSCSSPTAISLAIRIRCSTALASAARTIGCCISSTAIRA